ARGSQSSYISVDAHSTPTQSGTFKPLAVPRTQGDVPSEGEVLPVNEPRDRGFCSRCPNRLVSSRRDIVTNYPQNFGGKKMKERRVKLLKLSAFLGAL